MSAMGDVAMTVPVLKQLLEVHPEVRITVLTRNHFAPLFRDLPRTQFLEADIYGSHKGVSGLIKLAKEVRKLQIDLVVDLHNVLRSKVLVGYLRLKGVKCLVMDKGRAQKRELIGKDGVPDRQLISTHQRYASVFELAGVPFDLQAQPPYSKASLSPRLKNLIGNESRKAIGYAPFAAHSGKMYPLEKTQELVDRLAKEQDYLVLLFGGGAKETEYLDKLAAPLDGVINVAGKLTFAEELDLISNLDLMISMDSGNGHLAALYQVPVLTLWGVTHPCLGFAPFGQKPEAQLLPDLDKYPLVPTSVYGNKVPEGYQDLMESIAVDEVLDRIKALI